MEPNIFSSSCHSHTLCRYSLYFKLVDRIREIFVHRRCLDFSLFTSHTTSQASLPSRTNTSCKITPRVTEINSEIWFPFTPLFNVVVVSSKSTFLNAKKWTIQRFTPYWTVTSVRLCTARYIVLPWMWNSHEVNQGRLLWRNYLEASWSNSKKCVYLT